MDRGVRGDDSAWSAGHRLLEELPSEGPGIQDPVQFNPNVLSSSYVPAFVLGAVALE